RRQPVPVDPGTAGVALGDPLERRGVTAGHRVHGGLLGDHLHAVAVRVDVDGTTDAVDAHAVQRRQDLQPHDVRVDVDAGVEALVAGDDTDAGVLPGEEGSVVLHHERALALVR